MAGHYPKLGVGSVSGPATITSAQMIDPYVPVDGTMNVTGGVAASTSIAVGGVTAVKTTDYVATVADFLIPVDVNTTGNVIVTLPAASAAKGQLLTVKATATHATRTITIQRAGADTIEGVVAGDTALILSPIASLDMVSLVSDGTSKWYLVSSSGTIT